MGFLLILASSFSKGKSICYANSFYHQISGCKKRGGEIVHINVKPTKKYVGKVTKTQTITK